ncbi:MAG: glutamate synthase small subunit [Candidatus Omnitrophica bacterium]|nr:glutamate synthase small subunit [Candidatus Omnitrophota bacterium]
MGDPKGFIKQKRQESLYRPVCERVKDFRHVAVMRSDAQSREQASRCMDCGTPFCHWGCPLGNYIPEWNDLMYGDYWREAFALLDATNNLPEVTGRVCPAPCEYACVLGINDDPVTVRENELAIIEHAFNGGLIKPVVPAAETGKKVAVVGSGPAGLSCAAQMRKAGHDVTIFEKHDRPGGILRYGIPDFKLEKWVLDRRVELMKAQGVKFVLSVNVGADYAAGKLLSEFDAVCLAGGSRKPRDLDIPGRDLDGIHFAMDYLVQSNRRVQGEIISQEELIDAKDKNVVVIGGGDTGADCVGTANRQGASCVVQIEIMPKPEECRTGDYPWPVYPLLLKTSSSHAEGASRQWSVLTKSFKGENGKVRKLECVRVEFSEKSPGTCPVMKEIPGSEFTIDAELVIIAVGFVHPEHSGLLEELGTELDGRGNVSSNEKQMTSVDKVFAAGDMRRGQSLIVWAISEGRRAAHFIDEYLMGKTTLPSM